MDLLNDTFARSRGPWQHADQIDRRRHNGRFPHRGRRVPLGADGAASDTRRPKRGGAAGGAQDRHQLRRDTDGRRCLRPCRNIAARLQEHARRAASLLPSGVRRLTRRARRAGPRSVGSAEHRGPRSCHGLGSSRTRACAAAAAHLGCSLHRHSAARQPERRPNDIYFASGVINDIVISLAACPNFRCLPAMPPSAGARRTRTRGSSAVCWVGYSLGTIMRRGGGGIRITVDLRETEEGDSIWRDRIEATDAEVFDVQDEIVARIVAGVVPSVRAAELRRALRQRPQPDVRLHIARNLSSGRPATRIFSAGRIAAAAGDRRGSRLLHAGGMGAQWHSLAVGQAWSESPDTDALEAGQYGGAGDPARSAQCARLRHRRSSPRLPSA